MSQPVSIGVTGANGFLGRQLISALVDRGFRTTALARRPSDFPTGARWTRSPSLDAEADWSCAVEGLDVIVHCAARAHIIKDTVLDPETAFCSVNLDGTVRLARQAAARKIRRFVFVSSIKVNGESTGPGLPFAADDQPAPQDAYGASKLGAERALLAIGAETGMEIVIIRPPLIYGPGVKANFRSLMRIIARGIPLPLGSVRNQRSLLFVGNLVDLILHVLDHPAAAGQVFLVRDGQDLSTSELVERLAEALEQNIRLLRVPIPLLWASARLLGKGALAQRLLGSLVVDDAATRSRLGWTPPYSVADGLSITARAFQAEQVQAQSR